MKVSKILRIQGFATVNGEVKTLPARYFEDFAAANEYYKKLLDMGASVNYDTFIHKDELLDLIQQS